MIKLSLPADVGSQGLDVALLLTSKLAMFSRSTNSPIGQCLVSFEPMKGVFFLWTSVVQWKAFPAIVRRPSK
jgi:hypothetical protein